MTHVTPEVEEILSLMEEYIRHYYLVAEESYDPKEEQNTKQNVVDALTTLTTKHQEELEKAKSERFIDGMIAATQWLIDNKHLKAGSELNAMMLQALAPTKTDKQTMCPKCNAPEVDAYTPRTVYACGSSDYDQRPDSFEEKCATTMTDKQDNWNEIELRKKMPFLTSEEYLEFKSGNVVPFRTYDEYLAAMNIDTKTDKQTEV